MNANVLKVVKIVASMASIGITLVTNHIAEKELDDKIAKKVAEQLAKVKES